MSGTTAVHVALLSRALAAAPGAAIPDAKIAKENVVFTPPVQDSWYRETFLPGEPTAAAIGEGSANRHVGVYALDVFWTKGNGAEAAEAEADRIIAAFPRGLALTTADGIVRITKSYRAPSNEEPDLYHVPVRVFWRADLSN